MQKTRRSFHLNKPIILRLGCLGCLVLLSLLILWYLLAFLVITDVDILQWWAVSLVPVYPTGVVNDHTNSSILQGKGIRVYEVKAISPTPVAEFYHQRLSQAPWIFYDEHWFGPPDKPQSYCVSFQRPILRGWLVQTYSLQVFPTIGIDKRPTGDSRVYIYSNYVPVEDPCKDPRTR